MNFRPRIAEEPEVSLTPLIDVVFLLLIFFMVSTSFRDEAELQIVLPETSAQPPLEEPDALNIAIDAQGRFSVAGSPVEVADRAQLVKVLSEVITADADTPVVIRADAGTAHEFVVRTLDVLGELGVRHIAIATEPRQE